MARPRTVFIRAWPDEQGYGRDIAFCLIAAGLLATQVGAESGVIHGASGVISDTPPSA